MFDLMVETPTRIDHYFADSKEEIEDLVVKLWSDEADFSVALTELQIFCDWEDRFDFGW